LGVATNQQIGEKFGLTCASQNQLVSAIEGQSLNSELSSILRYSSFDRILSYAILSSLITNQDATPKIRVCRPLIADSLAVEDAIFSFFNIETAVIPNSRGP